jgi:hypothetical protein
MVLINFIKGLDTKDWVTLIGIGITLSLALLNLIITFRNNRKTSFINSITASRIKWMDTVRNTISEFCGLAQHAVLIDLTPEEQKETQLKLVKLKFLINLQLNRFDAFDKKIIIRVDNIISFVKLQAKKQFYEEVDELIILSQYLLKLEWEGVKQESIKGILSQIEKDKLYEKYLKMKKSDSQSFRNVLPD